MKKQMKKQLSISLILAGSALLAGCQSAPKTMYQWDAYQPQVYQHFKGESPDQQIAILEKDLQTMNAKGTLPPPGYHAHLGLLYSIAGKGDLVAPQFENEKKLFPESSTYMDFLLNKIKKNDQ